MCGIISAIAPRRLRLREEPAEAAQSPRDAVTGLGLAARGRLGRRVRCGARVRIVARHGAKCRVRRGLKIHWLPTEKTPCVRPRAAGDHKSRIAN